MGAYAALRSCMPVCCRGRDELLEEGLDDPQPINSGMLFVRASAWSAAFVRAWRYLHVRQCMALELAHWQSMDVPISCCATAAISSAITLATYRRDAANSAVCEQLRSRPFYEQSCLIQLVLSGSLPEGYAQRMVLLPMLLANSPWGRHARHIWSGVGGPPMRRWAFDSELRAWNTSVAGVDTEVEVSRRAC